MGSVQTSEPGGWPEIKLKLERHPEFHSLVEYFEAGLLYYGENNIHNGGIDFIKRVEDAYGYNAELRNTVDVSFNGGLTYDRIFEGLMDITSLQEVTDNKMEVTTIRNDMWAKFISRLDTPVNIRSTTTLDGLPCTPCPIMDINLPSQKVRMTYEGHHERDTTISYTINDNQYGQIDFADERVNEIKEKFLLPRSENSERPSELFAVKYGGNYQFNIVIYTSEGGVTINSSRTSSSLKVLLQVNDNTPIVLTQTPEGTDGIDGKTQHSYFGSISLEASDFIRLYFLNDNAPGTSYTFNWIGNLIKDSYMTITADTTFPSSSAQGFYLHDAMAAVIERITGRNCFYSEITGRTDTNMRTYAADGCYSPFVLLKGLQVRGYTIDEKQVSYSFKHLWDGADPIFNLGLGYETVNGTEVIRLEDKEHFYDITNTSATISDIREIIREYDLDKIINLITVGYKKWQSEDISGLDDPQTIQKYATTVQTVKNELNITSDFIAASIATEVTRRQTIEESKDYKYDNETFIIHCADGAVSPDRYTAAVDEDFDSISNLLNSDTRYNLILSPKRNLFRWMNYVNGCLYDYRTSEIKFVSGEGNYDMITDYSCTTGNQCLGVICDPVQEKGDIQLSSYYNVFGFLHLPLVYTVDKDLSWYAYNSIRNNRNYAIRMSQTDTDHKRFFIKELSYTICKGLCQVVAWPYEKAPLRVIT